jgi:hypothetical protein
MCEHESSSKTRNPDQEVAIVRKEPKVEEKQEPEQKESISLAKGDLFFLCVYVYFFLLDFFCCIYKSFAMSQHQASDRSSYPAQIPAAPSKKKAKITEMSFQKHANFNQTITDILQRTSAPQRASLLLPDMLELCAATSAMLFRLISV